MPHVLDGLTVFDPEGHAVPMATLWDTRPAVLMFVRHFGCLLCKQQVAGMTPWLDRIRARGAELYVVGNGSVEQARAFRDEQRLPCPVLTDPTREAYCALEMRRGPRTVLRPVVLLRSLGAWLRGFRQHSVAGDPLQQGGVLVVEPGGGERFRYISRSAGDHPRPARVVESLPG
jgi:peroxiredoxin